MRRSRIETKRSRKAFFTVIAIIVVSFAVYIYKVAFFDYDNYIRKEELTRIALKGTEISLGVYKRANNKYPKDIQELCGYFKKESLSENLLIKDAWGRDFEYRLLDNGGVVISSKGADGIKDTKDDLIIALH